MSAQKLFSAGSALLLLAACATEVTSRPVAEGEPGNATNPDGSAVGTGTNFGGTGAGDGGTNNGGTPTCLAKSQKATQVPLHVVVVFDASSSMVEAKYEDPSGSATNRFDATRNAFVEYANTPAASSNVYMSVVPFGLEAALPGGSGSDQCAAAFYAPLLSDIKLPAQALVSNTLQKLEAKGNTPTAGGVLGGEAYAKKLKAQFPSHNVVMVLATDGDANLCEERGGFLGLKLIRSSTQVAVDALKQAKTRGFSTYVIGIGQSIESLTDMAVAGGTKAPLFIDGNSSAQVAQKLKAKFAEIRSDFSCELEIPETFPGSGIPTDKSQLNVQITSGAGVKTELVYSQTCAVANAYKYDNAVAPTKVLLCGSVCSDVRADANATQDLLLGCPVKVN